MRIRDLTLRTKVHGAFAIVLLLDILSGAAAAWGLGAVNGEAASIRELWLPSINALGKLMSDIEIYRLYEARALLTQDMGERLSSEELLWDARDNVFRSRSAYEKLRPHQDDDNRLIAAFDTAWHEQQEDSKRMLWYVFQDDGGMETARGIYNGSGRANFRQARAQLVEANASSIALAKLATERGKDIYVVTSLAILSVTLATAVLSFLSGLFIVNAITKPVAALTRAMRRIADDDLDQEMPSGNRRDEIGIMTEALEALRGQLRERRRLLSVERENAERLQSAERELLESERLAALGRMVAGVSHEINTPLGSAYTVATTLVETHRDFLALLASDKLRKSDLDSFLERVGRGSALMALTLEKASELIKTFKQVAVDQASSSRRSFDLGEIIGQVVQTTTPSFKHKPYKLSIETPEEIRMDSFPGPLGQVLGNLLSNAIIHGLEGRTDGEVAICTQRMGDSHVVITVSDNGRGIPPQHMPHLFEPFFTTRFGQGGSGLGLNIVHGIVTSLLGGTIEVKSAPGNGASFILRIPRQAPRDAAAPTSIQGGPSAARGES